MADQQGENLKRSSGGISPVTRHPEDNLIRLVGKQNLSCVLQVEQSRAIYNHIIVIIQLLLSGSSTQERYRVGGKHSGPSLGNLSKNTPPLQDSRARSELSVGLRGSI